MAAGKEGRVSFRQNHQNWISTGIAVLALLVSVFVLFENQSMRRQQMLLFAAQNAPLVEIGVAEVWSFNDNDLEFAINVTNTGSSVAEFKCYRVRGLDRSRLDFENCDYFRGWTMLRAGESWDDARTTFPVPSAALRGVLYDSRARLAVITDEEEASRLGRRCVERFDVSLIYSNVFGFEYVARDTAYLRRDDEDCLA